MSVHSKGIHIPENILPPKWGFFLCLVSGIICSFFFGFIFLDIFVGTSLDPFNFSAHEYKVYKTIKFLHYSFFVVLLLGYLGNWAYTKRSPLEQLPFTFWVKYKENTWQGYKLYIWQEDGIMHQAVYEGSFTNLQRPKNQLKHGTPFITIELKSNKVIFGTTKGDLQVEEIELHNGVISPWFTSGGSTLSGFKIATNNFALIPAGAFYGVDRISILTIEQLLTFIEQATQTDGCVVSAQEGKKLIRFDLSVASLLTELEATKEKLSSMQARCDELEGVEADCLRAVTTIGKIVEDLHDRDFIGKSPKARILKLAIWDTWGKTIQEDLPPKPMYAVLDEQLERHRTAK